MKSQRQWKRVAHISDIHIRTIARQGEYKAVFEKLFLSLRNEAVDAVIITGDTVHGKTQMSPELIEMLYFLFENLNKLGIKIIIIPGNHDASLSNLSRTDALSPVLMLSEFKNIDYLRDTGVYNYGDVDIYHYSVFQDKSTFDTTIQNPDNTNIALYHGPINGSQNEFQFTFESNMTAGFFRPFDFTMLGDIHMRQCLQEENPIWYAGSLIQQNYGEEVEKGYLIWDLTDKSVEFIKIENDNAFHTLYAKNNILEDKIFLASSPRVRLYFDKLSMSRLEEIKSEVVQKYGAIEIIPHEVEGLLETDLKDEFEDSDFYDIAVQNKLIKEYLRTRYPSLTKKETEKIIEVNSDIEHIVKEDPTYSDKKSMSRWTLGHMQFDNFFTFGEDNRINFKDLTGITGILGANAQGKSSILETITFAIFGTTSKQLSLAQLVNNQKDKAKVYITLESDGQLYEVERKLKVHEKAGKRGASQTLTFNRIDKDQGALLEELNGDDKNATEKNIREIFGTSDDFLNTAMIAQNNWASFIKSKDTNRKNILMSFLDLTAFDRKHKVANKINNDNITVLKELNKDDLSSQLAGTNKEIVKATTGISNRRGDGAAYKVIARDIQKEKDALQAQVRAVKGKEIDVPNQENTIEAHKTSIKKLGVEAQDLDKLRRTKRRESLDMVDEIFNLAIESETAAEKLAEVTKTNDADRTNESLTWGTKDMQFRRLASTRQESIMEFTSIIMGLESKIMLKEQEIKANKKNQELITDDFVEHDVCSKCILVKFALDARGGEEKLNNELVALNNEIISETALREKERSALALIEEDHQKANDIFDGRIEELDKEIESVRVLSESTRRLVEENQSNQDTLSAQAELLESKVQTKIAEARSIGQQIKAIQAEIALYKENQKTIEQNKSLMSLIETKQNKIDEANKFYEIEHEKEMEFTNNLAMYKERRDNISEKMDQVKEKRIITDRYSYYLAAVHRNGIPSDIISNALHKVNFEISRLLDSVVNFQLNIVDDNDKIGVYLKYVDGELIPVEAASGMESIMSEIAIRNALLKISMKPKPTLIAIDEGFSALDSETQASLHSMFTVLRSAFRNTFIISHIEQLKDYMDNNIDLRKENNETHIGNISTL